MRPAGHLCWIDKFLLESRTHVYIDLLENSRTGVDKAVRSSCFYHENVSRSGLLDYIADHESRVAFLQEHDLVVFVNMQRRSPPGRRLEPGTSRLRHLPVLHRRSCTNCRLTGDPLCEPHASISSSISRYLIGHRSLSAAIYFGPSLFLPRAGWGGRVLGR